MLQANAPEASPARRSYHIVRPANCFEATLKINDRDIKAHQIGDRAEQSDRTQKPVSLPPNCDHMRRSAIHASTSSSAQATEYPPSWTGLGNLPSAIQR